ncbi:hypothetical protein [Janthinobacterium sp. 17J80-10]|uniref:hypothetical protein n=1 Tax=Janthinobacterium sp. 17J80-10 TaxID=2497863 RepID=UPI0010056D08|nr:hypothetical protein [Janthinobacterium sp. 17J80-10]QAU34433.1 hypothetical protein EKL02_09710 [Janthinobacterium sp. 17J80-10]
MQYRYGAKSLERNQFDAVKAKLLHSRAINSCRASLPGDSRNYAGRFIEFAGKIRFFTGGRPLETASVPLHAGPASLLHGYPGPGTECLPPAPDAAVVPPVPGSRGTPPQDNFLQDTADESGLRAAGEHISTAVLGGVLSVTVAIAAGLIVANTTAFKLTVAPEMHAAAEVTSNTPATTIAADVVVAQPARTIQAPPAPSLSISKQESQRTESPLRLSTTTTRRKLASPSNKVLHTKIARRAEKPKMARSTRRTAPAPIVRTAQKQPEPVVQAYSEPNTQIRPAVPSLATQYARCTQQQGFLRRERCKWEVCGGKWGKQGCPAYKYRVAPEMGLGQFYPADAVSQREGG